MPASLSQKNVSYSERVLPNFGIFVAATALLPAITVVLAPFNVFFGIAIGSILTVISWVALVIFAPNLKVTQGTFHAGSARLPATAIGQVIEIGPDRIFAERGTNLNSKAFTLFQGSVRTAVRIELNDTTDPTPYWLISTRKPIELKAALDRLKDL